MEIKEINNRYSELAESDCCLSCGGAINYAEPLTGEVCVDLGSGRGTDVLRMAESVGETGFVYGIDISDGMLEKARQNAAKFNATNVKFVRSGLESLELPDRVADLVISNCTINHAANKQAVWDEIYRILKKGGRFVISDIYSTTTVPDEYRNDPVAIAECWAGSVTREEYLKQLDNAGFSSVSILEESAPYDKGKIKVASWTIASKKPKGGCSCGC
ncbi:methyltransferase domain-containing protein [Williamwhitmania taraxaci]|uniref:Arsenite methyltransferase n=1 Tax=Williamwhitmania taraxaci TaxID=1640674 RepID=A0A1G6HFE5_9BACT|nr:methyltransferase domain-containing protein [Williamwhitmania taraxaci]SDB92665.1 Methyltransferase domain-containing protein [Williamwhitmania taraxaci]